MKNKTGLAVTAAFEKILKQGRKPIQLQFTTNNTLNFVPVLQSLVKGYNHTYYPSIKMAPNQVTEANSSEVYANLYKNKKVKKPTLKIGDRMCLNKKFRLFKKGNLLGWTEGVIVI